MTVIDARGQHKVAATRSPVWLALWLGRWGQHGPVHVTRLSVAAFERLARRMARRDLRAFAGGFGVRLGGAA